MKKVRTS